MADPVRLALIHAEIDGELDARQRAELARSLLADPETRALREDLRRVCATLDAVQEVEPPPQLRASILGALPQTRRGSATSWPVSSWWSAPVLRYAAAVAGVLTAGAIVFAVLDGQRPAATDVAGTLAGSRATMTLDTVQLTSGPVAGRVSLVRDAAGFGLALELKASAPVDVFVAGSGYTFRINGLGQQHGPGAGRSTVALPGFRMDGQSVDLTFLMAGQEVGRATLKPTDGH
jgi:hypothetical protein